MNEKITYLLHSACSLLIGMNAIALTFNFQVFYIPFLFSICGAILNYVL